MLIDIVVPPALVAGIIAVLELIKVLVRIFGGDPATVPSAAWRIGCMALGFVGAAIRKILEAGALPQTVEAWVAIVIFGWVVALAAGKAYDETVGKARQARADFEEAVGSAYSSQ